MKTRSRLVIASGDSNGDTSDRVEGAGSSSMRTRRTQSVVDRADNVDGTNYETRSLLELPTKGKSWNTGEVQRDGSSTSPALATRSRHAGDHEPNGEIDNSINPLLRHSVRRVVLEKKPKPTFNIQHKLLLEPTLLRQARKRREKERVVRAKQSSSDEIEDEEHGLKSGTSDVVEPSDQVSLRRSPRQNPPVEDSALKKRQEICGLKKPSQSATERNKAILHKHPSALSSVSKAPKRKMSAMFPDLPPTAATLHSKKRAKSDTVPDETEDLVKLADLFRRKKKKPKKRKRLHSLEQVHVDNEKLPGEGRREMQQNVDEELLKDMRNKKENKGSLTQTSATVQDTLTGHQDATTSFLKSSMKTQEKDSYGLPSDSDDVVEVVGCRPASGPRRRMRPRAFQAPPSATPTRAAQAAVPCGPPIASTNNLQSSQARSSGGMLPSAQPAWHNWADETEAVSEMVVAIMMKRKKYVLDYLMAANNFAAIFAGLAAINDLHREEEFSSTIARILFDAQTVGILMLTRLLTEQFLKPTSHGGLGYSELEAGVYAKRIIDRITPTLLGDMVILPEHLVATGLDISQVLRIAPILGTVTDEVRRKFFLLSDQVLSIGSDSEIPAAVQPLGTTAQLGMQNNRHPTISSWAVW